MRGARPRGECGASGPAATAQGRPPDGSCRAPAPQGPLWKPSIQRGNRRAAPGGVPPGERDLSLREPGGRDLLFLPPWSAAPNPHHPSAQNFPKRHQQPRPGTGRCNRPHNTPSPNLNTFEGLKMFFRSHETSQGADVQDLRLEVSYGLLSGASRNPQTQSLVQTPAPLAAVPKKRNRTKPPFPPTSERKVWRGPRSGLWVLALALRETRWAPSGSLAHSKAFSPKP